MYFSWLILLYVLCSPFFFTLLTFLKKNKSGCFTCLFLFLLFPVASFASLAECFCHNREFFSLSTVMICSIISCHYCNFLNVYILFFFIFLNLSSRICDLPKVSSHICHFLKVQFQVTLVISLMFLVTFVTPLSLNSYLSYCFKSHSSSP